MKKKIESDPALEFIKLFLEKVYALRFYYILSFFLFATTAIFYNKYSTKVYRLSSIIGPVRDTRSSALASNDMFKGTGSQFSSGKELEYALNSLNSFTLISKTVNNLNLEIGYFVISNRFFKKSTEVYLQSPFTINIDKSHIQPIGVKFNVSNLTSTSFRLTASSNKVDFYNYIDNEIVAKNQTIIIDILCKFNETIDNKYFKFTVSPKSEFLGEAMLKKEKYFFEFYHPEELAKSYMKSLEVVPESYLASIINIKFSSQNLRKSLNFLNSYVNLFLDENLQNKNKIAKNTINFIDTQISEMSDSLGKSESKLRNYRSDNQVLNISFQGQKVYEQLSQLETERTNLEIQIRYYNYLLNYFKTNQDISGITPPSSANINDAIINTLISEVIKLNAEKLSISNNTEKNLFSTQIDNKIKIQKQTIIDNATNNLITLNINLNELIYKSDKLSKEISNLPRKEMNMVNVQRKFDLNNTIYTYLLQKRTESAITLSSNYPDYEILEPAREITSEVIKPKKNFNYLIAIFLAFLIPTMYLIINEILNDKITSVYDIEHMIDRPLFGTIYRNSKKYESVVMDSPGSAIAESFRNIRSSLFLKFKDKQPKVILITSSQPQDGKSFISFNLAASIASVKHKTVIIDCDLRRPVLHNKFNNDNSKGISNYITNNATEEEIIFKTSEEKLFFIPAGPILPNPSELIGAGVLDNLINSLLTKFDYVIIDTAPIGLVSDSIQLMKYATQILIVTRNNYTKKDIVRNAISSLESNKIDNFDIILNDLDIERSPYSEYKHYYNKG